MDVSVRNMPPTAFTQASVIFSPLNKGGGQLWLRPPVGMNTKTAAFFSGATEVLTSTSAAFDHGANPFSMQIWIRQDVSAGRGPMGFADAWYIRTFSNTKFVVQIRTNASNYIQLVQTATPLLGNYHHLVLTYDGGSTAASAKLYYDGVQDIAFSETGTFTGMKATPGGVMRLGDNPFFNNFAGGQEDHAQWSRELSPAEAATLWNGGAGQTHASLPAGLLVGLEAWNPLDETNGFPRLDSQNNNDFAESGSVGFTEGHTVTTAEVGEPMRTGLDQFPSANNVTQLTIGKQPILVVGGHLNDDGTADSINVNLLQSALSSSTIGMHSRWVRPTSGTPGARQIIVGFGDTDADSYLVMSLETDGRLRASSRIAGVDQWELISDNVVFATATWGFPSVVQDGVSPVLYFDGALIPATFTVAPLDATSWHNDNTGLDNGRLSALDFNSGGEVSFYDGDSDHFYAYDSLFNASEILDLYTFDQP